MTIEYIGATTRPNQMTIAASPISSLGTTVEHVTLDIDYQIIEHFSRHLYGSANKAIEELVANGFDAYAEKVQVYLPGQFSTNYVAVWDDGWSMGIDGLKDLWMIASSPKESLGRVAEGPRGPRKMIGKFGIGKLASYTIGDTITHLCRTNDMYFAVTVDYRDIHPGGDREPVTSRNPLSAPIRVLTADQASLFVSEVFDTDREPQVRKLLARESWTLVVVGSLKGKEIQQGRLMWVLGNGMPLRPDFRVWLNDEEVGPRLERNAVEEWDLASTPVQEALEPDWRKAVGRGEVGGELEFGREVGLDSVKPEIEIPYAFFPELGWVWGFVRLFEISLLDARASEHGRSHGFFIMVRGRLLNTDDPELFLKPPSYGTFYRSQFVLNIDALDEELLADRSRLQQDTAKARELALLQQSLYMAARTFLENRDAQRADEEKHLASLPTRSREFYREPVTALLVKAGSKAPLDFKISKPRVERRPLGADQRLSKLSPDGQGFLVNASHPYFKVLERRLGKSRKAQEFYRTFDLFAVSDLLLEGHLYDIGLTVAQVDSIVLWREGLFRELAKAYEAAPSELAMELVNSSYIGGASFEMALAKILESMGFVAERRGDPGKEDVFLMATIGPGSYSLIFEAKGSRHRIANDEAEVGGAASHREKAGAEHAVIVAREFGGFGGSTTQEAAILGECRAVGSVSIMTVEALNLLSEIVNEFGYPLDIIRDVFTTLETPPEKLKRIQGLQSPQRDFDYERLLNSVWHEQQHEASGDLVAYRRIWQTEWKSEMTFEQFEQKLVMLETLAAGRIRVMLGQHEMFLLQSPSIVLEAMGASLLGRGASYSRT